MAKKRLTKHVSPAPTFKHGTVRGYGRYKCRCDLCKGAKAEETRRYYEKNRERVLARTKTYASMRLENGDYPHNRVGYNYGCRCEACTQSKRWYDIERRYGLTEDQYRAILEAQGGHCAICPSDDDLVIDHDHRCCDRDGSCGKCVRGIICRTCNRGLGYLKDEVEYLSNAVKYLSTYQSP